MVADGSAAGYSPFVAYLHADSKADAMFVSVHVDGLSSPLLLTPEHMLFHATSELGALEAVRSDAIAVGDYVSVTSSNTTTRARVTTVGRTWQRGFVAPLTESGQIAVDGVVASCYADVTGHTHDVAHTAMKPLVWLTRMFPALARQSAGHSDIHWYAQVLVRLVRMGNDAAGRLDELRAMLS